MIGIFLKREELDKQKKMAEFALKPKSDGNFVIARDYLDEA